MFELAAPKRAEFPAHLSGGKKPEIVTRGDVTIFALHHDVDRILPEERHKILPILGSCDNLLCEGTSRFIDSVSKYRLHAYEKYLINAFQGKLHHPRSEIHPLEDGCDMFRIAEKYGLTNNEMGAYLLLAQYNLKPFFQARDLQSATTVIDDGIKKCLLVDDDFMSLDIPTVRHYLQNIFRNKDIFPPNFTYDMLADSIRIAGNIAIVYAGFIREYEFIMPNIKRLMSQLPGRKGIIVGKMHLDAVEKALENEDFAKPVKWADFIDRFEPIRKGAILRARKLMFTDTLIGVK